MSNNKDVINLTEEKEIHIDVLRHHASSFATRFFSPIYLVGSFIDKGIDALDVDLIMVLTKDRWLRLFRNMEINDRYFRFVKKQKEWFEKGTHYDIDFKVQTYERFDKYKNEPRIRLDDLSDNLIEKESQVAGGGR